MAQPPAPFVQGKNKPKVYTTVDDINYHLSNVFALYPTLYAVTNGDSLSAHLQVVAPLIKNSREFCESIKNKKMWIGTSTGAGGFSKAGPFEMRSGGEDRTPMASGISFAPDGSWTSYFMETFSKTSHEPVNISIGASSPGGGHPDVIFASDPVHEGIVGALASHLFDIGVAPSFMKYLGLYVCDDAYKVRVDPTGSTPVRNVTTGKPYFLFERSDIEMYKFLGGEWDDDKKAPDLFAQTTPYDFMIWSTQLAHTQFVGKYYFGITHIDGHTNNIMLTNVKNTGRAIKWKDRPITPLTYSKVKLSEAEYYDYEMPFKVNANGVIVGDFDPSGMKAKIMIENNGLLPKEIDFGLTLANLKESVVSRAQNVAFSNEPSTYDKPVMGYTAVTQPTKGDLDYNFTTLNIAWRIARAIQIPEVGYSNKNHYKTLWTGILPFWQATLPSQFDPSNIAKGGFTISAKKLDGSDETSPIFGEFSHPRGSGGGFHMRKRPVGTTSDIQSPLKKIWTYLSNAPLKDGSNRRFRSSDGKTMFIQLSRDNTNIELMRVNSKIPPVSVPYYSNPRFSNLQKFITYNFALWRACVPRGKYMTQAEIDKVAKDVDPNLVGKNSVEFCATIDDEIAKYDPNDKKPLAFFHSLVTPSTTIWDSSKKMLRSGITRRMLEVGGFQRSRTGATQLFTLRFNPSQIEMDTIAGKEKLAFNAEQRMTNYQPPSNIGEPMKMVNVHLVYASPADGQVTTFGITVENRDLYKAAKYTLARAKSGFSVNGGYFIVPGNYNDPLNWSLSSGLSGMPIGYFYSRNTPQFNGTMLPIPRKYRDDFATLYVTTDASLGGGGKLKMERSKIFQSWHETENRIVVYSLNRDPPVSHAVNRKAIKMELDPFTGIHQPVMSPVNTSFSYQSAFECGPILIWDGKIEFTREKMDTALFQIDPKFDIPSVVMPDGTPNTKAKPGEHYRVVTAAKTSKMYFNEPGESSFPYGQRHSNSLMIHNVACETNSGDTIFVFVEGRGFDSVGLDRAQLAELISRFDVKHAVSLDGGFSANAVLKRPNNDEMGYYWLLNDPDKRMLSTAIHFIDNS